MARVKQSIRARLMPGQGAVAVAVVLGLPSPTAAASGAPKAAAASEDVLAEVGALFQAGQDRFEVSDFEGAIDRWARAYGQLPDEPQYRATRALLLANLAQAHVEAHGVGGPVDHLRQAEQLFGDYLALLDPSDSQTRQTIEAERSRIEQILEQESAPESEAPDDPESESEPTAPDEPARGSEASGDPESGSEPTAEDPSESTPPGPTPANDPADRAPVREERPSFSRWERGVGIGGGVTVLFAVGLTGAMGTFVWLSRQEERAGEELARNPNASLDDLRARARNVRRFNQLAISTGTVAGLFGAVGLGLVGAALDRRTRRLRGLARVAPSLGPLGAGATVSGRF